MEIPGQYSSSGGRPEASDRVLITGFEPQIRVMSSLRQPKVVTMRGNDGGEYAYLVKAGEDLRQDARVQELFTLMNAALAADDVCRRRQLELRTYSVVPMTTRVGLIQFVPGVAELKEFVRRHMNPRELDPTLTRPHEKCRLNQALVAQKGLPEAYLELYQRSASSIRRAFAEAEDCIRPDLLRIGLQGICRSLRDFHLLQSHFVSSHAAVCAAQYLLGIGDRHQRNFMIDEATGGVVGIDFGHAFGSATQFLAIPELMPFRLTRQIRHALGPAGPAGAFQAALRESLRALRESRAQLLASMEVFVREPSLDWLQNAKRQAVSGAMPEPDRGHPVSWFPRQKLALATDKLRGRNPALVTRDELAASQHSRVRDGLQKGILAALLGEDCRARTAPLLLQPRGFPAQHLSPAQQASCLIGSLPSLHPTSLAVLQQDFQPWQRIPSFWGERTAAGNPIPDSARTQLISSFLCYFIIPFLRLNTTFTYDNLPISVFEPFIGRLEMLNMY